MKKKTGLLICVSALVLSLGVTLGIEAVQSDKLEKTNVAEAAYEAEQPLNAYLSIDFNDGGYNWTKDGAVMMLKLTWTTGDEWVYLQKADDTHFNYSIPNAHNLVALQFVRTGGTSETPYNYSTYNTDLSKTVCSVTWWNNSSNWESITGWGGYEGGQNELFAPAVTTPSASTKRVWVCPKDSFFDGNARAGLRVYKDGGAHYITYVLTNSDQCVHMTHEGEDQLFFYVDIPVDDDCQMVRLNNVFNFYWTYSNDFVNIGGWNTTLIMYCYDSKADISAGGIDDAGNYTVEYAERVLDGFSTCESSDVNGYGAYSNINTNILSKSGVADNIATLRAATFTASGYGTRTYGEKIDRMSASAQAPNRIANNISLSSTVNSDTAIIVIVSAVAVAAVGGFFFLKKKY